MYGHAGKVRRYYQIALLVPSIVISVFLTPEMISSVAVAGPIEQKYVSNQFGFEVMFPSGWSSSPSYLDDNTTLFVNLLRTSNHPELGANDLSSMSISAGKNLSSLNLRIKQNSLYENCNLAEKYYQTIHNKNFTASLVKCPTIYYKTYHFQSPALTLNYTYTALPSAYELNKDDFEKSVRTLKIS
jgi:hypothetical protein